MYSNPARPVSRNANPTPMYGAAPQYAAPQPGRPISRAASPVPGMYGSGPTQYAAPQPARPISRAASPVPGAYGAAPQQYVSPAYGPPRPLSRAGSPQPGYNPSQSAYGAPGYPTPYGGGPQYVAPQPARPISRAGSPNIPGGVHSPGYNQGPSVWDFQIEKAGRPLPPMTMPNAAPVYLDDPSYRESIAHLISAKDRQFAIAGGIPVDVSQLVLFFRAKSGVTHSLDFPIDVDYHAPPPFDILLAACLPYQDRSAYADREALFYPPNLPLTTSMEIANHPVLNAVRTALFPNLLPGTYLIAIREKLDVLVAGSRLGRQAPASRNDGRAATIIITLPVRFRGGALIVRDRVGNEEKFFGRGGKPGEIEWTAFLGDCEYEMEPVQKGCRLSIAYGVYLKTYGPNEVNADQLIGPSDNFFDLTAPILNMSRGRKIAFYLSHDYGVVPSESLASTLVPLLKGGDSLLYHSFKMYKLTPELHWTAGGYIWPPERTVDLYAEDVFAAQQKGLRHYGGGETAGIQARVVESGAISLNEANITILRDWNDPAPIVGKERVPFVSNGVLEKLVINAILVVYVA